MRLLIKFFDGSYRIMRGPDSLDYRGGVKVAAECYSVDSGCTPCIPVTFYGYKRHKTVFLIEVKDTPNPNNGGCHA